MRRWLSILEASVTRSLAGTVCAVCCVLCLCALQAQPQTESDALHFHVYSVHSAARRTSPHRAQYRSVHAMPLDSPGVCAMDLTMNAVISRRPFEIRHLDLPPGSLVSFPAHMPHFVAPRKAGTGMRWGLLLTYRRPDPKRRFASISRSVPEHWAAHTLRPELRPLFAEF